MKPPFALVALVLLAQPLAAQQTPPPDTTRPLVRGGVYDKPYLTTLFGRAAIGGYAEAHARWDQVDGLTEDAGFVLQRFNLFASTRVSDFVRFAAELEFEEAGEEVVLELAAVDVLIHSALGIRGGMLLSPLGRFNLSHDSPLNEFTDRPLVSTELIGVALSEPGLGLFGGLPIGAGRVTYEIYAVNGFHDGMIAGSEGGTRIPLGRRNVEDNNRTPSVVGRLAWSPGLFLEVGASAHHGPYNESVRDGLEVDASRDLTILVADAELTLNELRISGEYAHAAIDVPAGLLGIYADRQAGGYGEVVWDFGRGLVPTMPASYFTAALRFDAVDFDRSLRGDMERRIQLGLNFRPTRETALKLSAFRGTSRDRFNNAAAHAGLRFSIASYF